MNKFKKISIYLLEHIILIALFLILVNYLGFAGILIFCFICSIYDEISTKKRKEKKDSLEHEIHNDQ